MTDESLTESPPTSGEPETDIDPMDMDLASDAEETELSADDPDVQAALVPEQRLSSRWSDEDRARERELFSIVQDPTRSDAERTVARNELVTLHLSLVSFLARRFRDRGEPLEDLIQVGTIGLINAVDRFDTERGFNDDDATTIADFMGDEDPYLGNVDDREALRPLLAALPARERQILGMRFFQGMTQGQIAEELNISQMHVSRLLARSLATLREGMLAD